MAKPLGGRVMGQLMLVVCVLVVFGLCLVVEYIWYFTHFVEQSILTMSNFAPTKDDVEVIPQRSKTGPNHLKNENMI